MKKVVSNAYVALRNHFGPQGWWPLLDEKGVLRYHRAGDVLSEREQLEICVGALLTQNTAWTNVIPALQALSKKNLLSVEGLRKVPAAELARAIRPAGYYNQKARKLKEFAGFVSRVPGGLAGVWGKPVEVARRELLSVWGIGPETADSMLLYAGGKPVFVVDAYTVRAVGRLGWMRGGRRKNLGGFRHYIPGGLRHYGSTSEYGRVQEFFHEHAQKGFRHYKEFHALFVELGKRYCTQKTPACGECPLRGQCAYAASRRGNRGINKRTRS